MGHPVFAFCSLLDQSCQNINTNETMLAQMSQSVADALLETAKSKDRLNVDCCRVSIKKAAAIVPSPTRVVVSTVVVLLPRQTSCFRA